MCWLGSSFFVDAVFPRCLAWQQGNAGATARAHSTCAAINLVPVEVAAPRSIPRVSIDTDMFRHRLCRRGFPCFALAWCVMQLAMGDRPAAAQTSPYGAASNRYSTSPYRASYTPVHNPYAPRNYSGLVSNHDYYRRSPGSYINALYATPRFYGGWNDRLGWGLSYRYRYGLGYNGPWYPSYYYGYSNFFRPWYRWYGPWGWGMPYLAPWPQVGNGIAAIPEPPLGVPGGTLPGVMPAPGGLPWGNCLESTDPVPLEPPAIAPQPSRIYGGVHYW